MLFNPNFDLTLERIVDVPAHKIWEAWTVPAKLMPWFCPKPWSVSECEIDLRPGGKFYTLMRGPNGESMPNTGCFLEIIPDRKLVWTGALGEDFRPNPVDHLGFPFTGVIELSPHGGAQNTSPLFCITAKKTVIPMRKWVLRRAGAPRSIKWWR